MAFDPNDPRIQALIKAMQQQGAGKPMFGGAHHSVGGAGGRGLANYYRPSGAGINFNPLAAQMSQGAPGLLGLNSGHDNNPSPNQVGPPQDPGAQAPPVQVNPGGVGSGPPPGGVNPGGVMQPGPGAAPDPTPPPYTNDNGNMEWDSVTQSWVPKGQGGPGGSAYRPGLQGAY